MIHLVNFIESSGFLSHNFTIRLLRHSLGQKGQVPLGRRGRAGTIRFLGSAAESLSTGAPVWLSA
jgi:hypothetical protein